MNFANIIRKYFSDLNQGNGVPLYKQLHDCIGRLIADLPDKAEFPPERELAAELNINRITLRRALKPYVDNEIIRRSNKGSFVNKKTLCKREEIVIHPLMLDSFAYAPVQATDEIELMLYENLPNQLQFWEEATDNFFQKTKIRVKLTKVALECNNLRDYLSKINMRKPDIFQLCNESINLSKESKSRLTPVTELTTQLMSNDYRVNDFFKLENHALDYAVPICFNSWSNIINFKLAEKYGISLDNPERSDFLDNLIKDAVLRFPSDIYIAAHSSGLLYGLGLPEQLNRESLEEFVGRGLDIIKELRPHAKSAFAMPLQSPFEWYSAKALQIFTAGRLLILTVPNYFLRHCQSSWNFPVCKLLPDSSPHGLFMHSAVMLGIYKDSYHREQAQQFLSYLLTEPLQSRLAELSGSVPMCRKSSKIMHNDYSGSWSHIDNILSRYREMSHPHVNTFWRGFSQQPYFEKMLYTKTDKNLIQEEIVEKYMLRVNNCESRVIASACQS
jgi:hypothetical protein